MKCKISNSKLIKSINQELSESESKYIEMLINNSESCSKLVNELKSTYNLIDRIPKLKDNSNLYLNVINKATKISEKEPLTETYSTPVFSLLQSTLVAVSIIIAIISGVFIGNQFTEQTTNIEMATTINSEFYLNGLQLENIENYLWEN